jgi:hypothetical protein
VYIFHTRSAASYNWASGVLARSACVSDIVESARNLYFVEVCNPAAVTASGGNTCLVSLTTSNFDFTKAAVSGSNFRLFDEFDTASNFQVTNYVAETSCDLRFSLNNDISSSGLSRYYLYVAQTGVSDSLSVAIGDNPTTPALESFVYPFVSSSVKHSSFNIGDIGSAIIAGEATNKLSLERETGTNARLGSGSCAKLTPLSKVISGRWHFYLPATASTEFQFSFYFAKSVATFDGILTVTIYDTDQSTLLLNNELVDTTSNEDVLYHLHECSAVTPTSTGFCLVEISLCKGVVDGSIFIDDINVE